MIAHIAEFEGPAEVLEGVGMQGFRDRVIPVLEAQPGFEGYLILLNREKGNSSASRCGTPRRTVDSLAQGWNRNVGQELMRWGRPRRLPDSTTSSRNCRSAPASRTPGLPGRRSDRLCEGLRIVPFAGSCRIRLSGTTKSTTPERPPST